MLSKILYFLNILEKLTRNLLNGKLLPGNFHDRFLKSTPLSLGQPKKDISLAQEVNQYTFLKPKIKGILKFLFSQDVFGKRRNRIQCKYTHGQFLRAYFSCLFVLVSFFFSIRSLGCFFLFWLQMQQWKTFYIAPLLVEFLPLLNTVVFTCLRATISFSIFQRPIETLKTEKYFFRIGKSFWGLKFFRKTQKCPKKY